MKDLKLSDDFYVNAIRNARQNIINKNVEDYVKQCTYFLQYGIEIMFVRISGMFDEGVVSVKEMDRCFYLKITVPTLEKSFARNVCKFIFGLRFDNVVFSLEITEKKDYIFHYRLFVNESWNPIPITKNFLKECKINKWVSAIS